MREIYRSAPHRERDHDSCATRHPGSVDCARRWRRRDAPTWSLARLLSPSFSLPVDFSTWHQREGYTSGWSVFPAKRRRPSFVVVHSRARIREFSREIRITPDPNRLPRRSERTSEYPYNVIESIPSSEVLGRIVFRSAGSTSLSSRRDPHRCRVDPRSLAGTRDEHESQLILSPERF